MHRYLKIYFILVKQELKRITEYKGDFIVGIIGFGLTQIFNFVFWRLFLKYSKSERLGI